MYPPAGGTDRDSTEDVVYGGYKIPAGTTVAVSTVINFLLVHIRVIRV